MTVGAVLLVVALTGAMLVFRPELDPVFNRDLFAVAPGGPPRTLDELVATAQRAHPGAQVDYVRLAREPGATVEIFASDRAAAHENARSYLFLDAYSGAVLRWTPYADSTPGMKLYLTGLSYHFGQFGGWAGRLILLAGVLAVPVMAGGVGEGAMARGCKKAPRGGTCEGKLS